MSTNRQLGPRIDKMIRLIVIHAATISALPEGSVVFHLGRKPEDVRVDLVPAKVRLSDEQ